MTAAITPGTLLTAAVIGFGLLGLVLFGIAVIGSVLGPVNDTDRYCAAVDEDIDARERGQLAPSPGESFHGWDADRDLATVLPFERRTPADVVPIPTDLMDHDGIGAA